MHITHWWNALRDAAVMTGCTVFHVTVRKRGSSLQWYYYSATRVSHLSEPSRPSWPPGPRFHSSQHRTSRRNGFPGSSCSLRDESGLVCRQPWLRVEDWQLAATARALDSSLLPNRWRAFTEWSVSSSTSGLLRQIRQLKNAHVRLSTNESVRRHLTFRLDCVRSTHTYIYIYLSKGQESRSYVFVNTPVNLL